MGLALYRKYRPKGLGDVVGQNHIVTTLKNALKSGKISHAYLFTGPRGVGKTSVARILAHEINGLPYTDDSVHLDIIEIDAASNRRIDEIRELRDKVHIAPTSAKYKVYIIDEVHMLTREAFNALLKTLEEPPAHVVFILATTESHKVPDTIASRTQRFNFKPITRNDTVGHLRGLAKEEGIKISDEALEALADHAGGSFRDSINLLDQMMGTGDSIGKEDIEATLGLPSPTVVGSLYASLMDSDIATLTQTLSDARVSGINAGLLAKALGSEIRGRVIQSGAAPDERTIQLLRNLISAAGERDAFAGLELALLDYTAVTAPIRQKAVEDIQEAPKKPTTAPPKAAIEPEPLPEPPPEETPIDMNAAEVLAPIVEAVSEDAYWDELLKATKKTHNTVYGVLRMAEPTLDGDELTLTFSFGFHQKQMSQAATQKRIADVASTLLGRPIQVKSVLQKDGQPVAVPKKSKPVESAGETTPKQSATPSSLNDVNSIFKGAELLE